MTYDSFDSDEFNVYRAAAVISAKWELPNDRLENGIVLHDVPRDTAKASAIVNSIRFAAKKLGYQIRVTWLDGWTMKVVWYK